MRSRTRQKKLTKTLSVYGLAKVVSFLGPAAYPPGIEAKPSWRRAREISTTPRYLQRTFQRCSPGARASVRSDFPGSGGRLPGWPRRPLYFGDARNMGFIDAPEDRAGLTRHVGQDADKRFVPALSCGGQGPDKRLIARLEFKLLCASPSATRASETPSSGRSWSSRADEQIRAASGRTSDPKHPRGRLSVHRDRDRVQLDPAQAVCGAIGEPVFPRERDVWPIRDPLRGGIKGRACGCGVHDHPADSD